MFDSVFVLGAQRCGTTYIFDQLSLHKSISPSFTKEVNYFSYNYSNDKSAFKKLFHKHNPSQLYFDSSPSYLFSTNAPKRLHSFFENPCFIVILRNPTARFISAHDLVKSTQHKYSNTNILELFNSEQALYSNPNEFALESDTQLSVTTLGVGLYYYQLCNWFRYFDKSRFFILDFDVFFNNLSSSFSLLYKFLGLEFLSPSAFKVRTGTDTYEQANPELFPEINNFYKLHNQKLKTLIPSISYD